MTEVKWIDMGGVNSYLLTGRDGGFILVDNGDESHLENLEKQMAEMGCLPGNLKLIILTHGDVDHVANTAYLCHKYDVKSAIHRDDAQMAASGDMTLNRKAKPDRYKWLPRILGKLVKSKPAKPFSPAFFLDEDFSLSDFGVDARILYTPGHSRGSISILTDEGDVVCGDLMMNILRPDFHFLIDDLQAARNSLEKLRERSIRWVYPGHGKPFLFEQFDEC